MTDIITHIGRIEQIDGARVEVRIVQTSACSACSAKGLCRASESKEKLIDVYEGDTEGLAVGQEVVVCGTTRMGMQAVFLAFCVPFVILIVALFVAYALTSGDEVASGLIAIAATVPYYAALYLTKEKMRRSFSFWLKR